MGKSIIRAAVFVIAAAIQTQFTGCVCLPPNSSYESTYYRDPAYYPQRVVYPEQPVIVVNTPAYYPRPWEIYHPRPLFVKRECRPKPSRRWIAYSKEKVKPLAYNSPCP